MYPTSRMRSGRASRISSPSTPRPVGQVADPRARALVDPQCEEALERLASRDQGSRARRSARPSGPARCVARCSSRDSRSSIETSPRPASMRRSSRRDSKGLSAHVRTLAAIQSHSTCRTPRSVDTTVRALRSQADVTRSDGIYAGFRLIREREDRICQPSPSEQLEGE